MRTLEAQTAVLPCFRQRTQVLPLGIVSTPRGLELRGRIARAPLPVQSVLLTNVPEAGRCRTCTMASSAEGVSTHVHGVSESGAYLRPQTRTHKLRYTDTCGLAHARTNAAHTNARARPHAHTCQHGDTAAHASEPNPRASTRASTHASRCAHAQTLTHARTHAQQVGRRMTRTESAWAEYRR